MHGSLRSPRNNRTAVAVVAGLIIGLALSGCSASGEANLPDSEDLSQKEFLAKHEKGFNPSLYNPNVDSLTQQENSLYTSLQLATVNAVAPPETIPGFRIQVVLTQEIDQAMSLRDSLSAQFQDEFVYLVYDAPTYKVRIGNFPDRSSATPLLKQLIRRGFSDAWIVPDNVLKNPPAKLPDQPIEIKNPPHERR